MEGVFLLFASSCWITFHRRGRWDQPSSTSCPNGTRTEMWEGGKKAVRFKVFRSYHKLNVTLCMTFIVAVPSLHSVGLCSLYIDGSTQENHFKYFWIFFMSVGKQPCHQNINFFTILPRVSEDWDDENVNTRTANRTQKNLLFLKKSNFQRAAQSADLIGRYTSAFSVGQRRVTPARWWMCCNQMMYAHRSPGWIPVPLFKTNGFSHISLHLCKDHSGISTAPLFAEPHRHDECIQVE